MAGRREAWLWIHLWMALILGFVFALMGLSGAVLVLRAPVLQWEVGAAALRLRQAPEPGTPYAQPDAWKMSAQAAYPQFERIMGVAKPRAGFLVSDNALVFGSVRGRKGIGIAMIDPYSSEPRAFFVYDDLFLASIVALHRSLFLPRFLAGPALGAAGFALLASLATGLWLWWPRGSGMQSWRRALSVGRKSRGTRLWRELHGAAAAYLIIPLALLTLTGIWLAQPKWFAWLGLGGSFRPVASAMHAELMLGLAGQVVTFLAGLSLPVLYVSGLVLWWTRRRNRRVAIPCSSS